MGEVYRARDPRLAREVAIKILPEAVAGDTDRLARFEREAQVLASLNHPNIASIYGLEESDGIRGLVLELVEGPTLAERIEHGRLSPTEALGVARQMAEGLEAAHERGIVHRDLKPANVKLAPDGTVKILDFGLAKAAEGDRAEADLSMSPTLTANATQAGVILGTAAYMSPEQARGLPVDRRADLWAFGVLLFEMLAGQRPFGGSVVSEILAKILERDPDWDALPEPLHPAVRRLLQRCLAKDPRRRFHDAADVRLEVEEVLDDPAGASFVGQPATPAAKPAAGWRQALPWALLGLLLLWALASRLPGPAAEAPLTHFDLLPPAHHEFAEFSVSADGSAIAFVGIDREGRRTLWLRPLDRNHVEQLAGTEGAMFPFWSPDSRSLAFFARGKLSRIDVASGSVQTLADAPNGRGGAWSEDGTILFTPEGGKPLYAMPASGGAPEQLTELAADETTHRFPHFLEGSRRFSFVAHAENSESPRRYVGSLDGEEPIMVLDGLSEAYVPPGRMLMVRQGTLVAQNLDASSGELSGEAHVLARNISDGFPRTGRSAYSVSYNGVLAYLQTEEVDTHLQWFSRTGRPLESATEAGGYWYPSLSHDGQSVAFLVENAGNLRGTLWLLDLARGASTRLGELEGFNLEPSWARDDSFIVHSDGSQIVKRSLQGGIPELIFDGSRTSVATSMGSIRDARVSSDNSQVVFSSWDPVTDYNLWILDASGDGEPVLLSDAPRTQASPAFSPDDRWLAYHSDESGRFEVYLRSTDPGREKWLISTAGGKSPMWSDDGTELYFVSSRDELMVVSIETTSGKAIAGVPEALFVAPKSKRRNSTDFFSQPRLLAIDGDRFLFHVPVEQLPPRTIQVVLNWEQLLQS
jgi:Tol biopolymer transport system component